MYDIMCKSMVDPDRPQVTVLYGACGLTKATDTHAEYVRLIDFPRQLDTRAHLNVTLYVHCLPY